jgi:LysM repeat protein/ABC-type branched-subunit amino acid transport system substrate-binding protein
MKNKRGIWIIALLTACLLLSVESRSQVPVEISKEKVIISGNQYLIHLVKKGQTAYSIARAYGIAVQDLTAENPPALYGVKEGQSLRIPVKSGNWVKPPEAQPAAAVKKDESKYVYHSLKAGETVYAISKVYGVSENEIIQSNPGIDITKLSVGTEIAVPKRNFMVEKQKFDQQEKKYIYHKVEKGETLASIAEKYGTTLRILRKENRNLRFPQIGDYVKVPALNVPEPEVAEPIAEDTVPVIQEEVVKIERPVGFTAIKDLKGTINIAVLLPFYLAENARRNVIDSSTVLKGRKQYKVTRRPEQWIYPQSLDFVEMYNGILLAADTLRSLGLDVTLHSYDIKRDTIAITKLIQSGKLANMDLIIGPVYSHNLHIVADYAKTAGIPVVSPVQLINNSVIEGNPTLFMTNASLEVAQRQLAKQISANNTSNLVFVHTDTLGNDPDVKRFKGYIFNELTQKMAFEDIRFREFTFYSRSAFGNDSINRMSHALSENSENIVIIASEDPAVISETITIIHGLSKKFDVKVYGYPSLMFIDNLDPRMFFELNMLVLSPYYVDYAAADVQKFNHSYLKKFLTMPLESSYAWTGYDIAYYFISGLAMHGKDFIVHPEMHNPELLQNKFEFERKSDVDGFENQKFFKLRYTKDYEVVPEE